MLELVLGLLLGMTLTGLAALILLGSGYRLKPKSIKFPFLDFDASRFDALSPVQMFSAVTKFVMPPSPHAKEWLFNREQPIDPIILVHLGWRVVCDTFVERHGKYPSEQNVYEKIGDLGAQNVEFIILYARVHTASIRDPESVHADFAREFFIRAPSIAQRINQRRDSDFGTLFELVYSTVQSEYRQHRLPN